MSRCSNSFNVEVTFKNDGLTRDCGDEEIANLLFDVILNGVRDVLLLPWVLSVEIDHATSDQSG